MMSGIFIVSLVGLFFLFIIIKLSLNPPLDMEFEDLPEAIISEIKHLFPIVQPGKNKII